eukprot:3366052-Karenia_brevis.AAC.1
MSTLCPVRIHLEAMQQQKVAFFVVLMLKYLNFKRHVCRQEYYSAGHAKMWEECRRREGEAAWPDYENETCLGKFLLTSNSMS